MVSVSQNLFYETMGVNIIKFLILSKDLEILFSPYLLEYFISDKIPSLQNFYTIFCPQQYGNLIFETSIRVYWSPWCHLFHLSGFDSGLSLVNNLNMFLNSQLNYLKRPSGRVFLSAIQTGMWTELE